MRRKLIIIGLFLVLLAMVAPVSAHAFPVRIDPPLNTALDQAPKEIHVWFSEAVEPQFSSLFLRDDKGNILQTAPSYVNPNDPTELILPLSELPDGIYTIVWRALSSSDGHSTLGNFPLMIGDESGAKATTESTDSIPADATIIRWANIFSLALGIGGLGFFLFVWKLAIREKYPEAERRIYLLIWAGWILIGITGFLLLLLQYELATGSPLLTGINGDSLNGLVANTRFGHLWLARMALWAGMGGALWFGRTDPWFNGIALVIGGAILAINSLFSHAAASHDVVASVIADWLHLAATAIWVGGLVQFINVIGVVRRNRDSSTMTLERLVGYFSNFARVSVAALVITGLYSFWLEVGSLDALFTTVYGQVLFIKGFLLLPVMGIAAINLFFTHRGLQAGQSLWEGRLRGLVGAEIALTTGILLAVGAMTSISPARTTLDQRLANPPAPEPQPFTASQTTDALSIQLTFSPGWIGNNVFTLIVTDSDGKPVNDASLIRLKFDSEAQNLGESELRPTLTGDGIYTISGANLSVPGVWRIRTTIQRPNQFDTLVDFKPDIPAIPVAPVVPLPAPDTPLPNREIALLLFGVVALAVGGFFLGENRTRPLRVSALLSIGLLAVGIMFLVSAVQGTSTAIVSASIPSEPFQPAPDAPIRLFVTESVALPYLITADGKLLQTGSDSQWHILPLDAKVRDAIIDEQGDIWAATDKGLYIQQAGQWKQESTLPAWRVAAMHGYVFALGRGAITRAPEGGGELEPTRNLSIPVADQPAAEIVMLGDHTHVLEIDGQLYRSLDLGVSWQPISSSQKAIAMSTDADGNLLAANDQNIQVWNSVSISWDTTTLPLPEGDSHAIMRTFNNDLYAVAKGLLYKLVSREWQAVDLPDSDNVYLIGAEYQYPHTLWVLDAKGSRLWATEDGVKWNLTTIKTG